ncbi:MAG: hypothetical protein PHO94_05035 [Petrimonas sp.]|nr:hypothetical protein [Petrimonas sp.]
MKLKHIILILFIVALAVAFFTNPDKQAHKEALKTKLTEVINESMAERQDDVVTFNAWKIAGPQMTEVFLQNNFAVDDYKVLSLTKINWDNQSYIVGVGAFGNVWITKRLNKELADTIIDQIENTVNDALPDFLKQWQ